MRILFCFIMLFCAVFLAEYRLNADDVLPDGVKAVWDLDKAHKETTATREKVSINGLWRWQPVGDGARAGGIRPPTDNWGYFKVPGSIPGITDWMQKDSQQVHAHPSWKNTRLRDVTKAWYQREIEIPANWKKRRILLQADYVNSRAVVYVKNIVIPAQAGIQTKDVNPVSLDPRLRGGDEQVTDSKTVGEILYPAGTVDLTDVCQPGKKYLLSIEVTALPHAEVIALFGDTNAPKRGAVTINRRGFCGDVWLVSEPKGPRITDVKIETSVRNKEITVSAVLENLEPETQYGLEISIFREKTEGSGTMTLKYMFRGRDIGNEQIFVKKFPWLPKKLWDIHTPENMYELSVSIEKNTSDAGLIPIGAARFLDTTFPIRFGFREFWIDGRDLYLNGTRIWLSCVPLDNAQVGAALANYEAAKESMLRLKSFGVNFVYTHNYDCNPGSFISFAEILRAADDVGMLVSFAQPHFGHFEWDNLAGTPAPNGYERIASFLVKEAQNHPSVIFYSMSHNSTGYNEDMNPFLMDGIAAPRSRWAKTNLEKASQAEAIVKKLDPSRIVYHHASGNLGPMHISNFYGNWIPVQEMSDWFGHWATVGTKPMFTCEYGVPFTWDWAMYRGWYKGKREFGSAPVPWEFCNAEWNAQFIGDKAFNIGEPEKRNLRWEAQKFRDGAVWCRWDYPAQLGSREFTDQDPILARYIHDNWRAFRTWGLSINSYWEHGRLWSLRPGVDKSRKNYVTDWDNLQRPGFSPDFQEQRYERIDLAFERDDWIPSHAAKALLRNNMPLLGYIAGKEGAFTSKDHNFLAGEVVEKQWVVVNNSRSTVDSFQCTYRAPKTWVNAGTGQYGGLIDPGAIKQSEFRVKIPEKWEPGPVVITAEFKIDDEIQKDEFTINVMPKPSPIPAMNIALFDPKGETAKMLDEMGVKYRLVQNVGELKESTSFSPHFSKQNNLSSSEAFYHNNLITSLSRTGNEVMRLGFFEAPLLLRLFSKKNEVEMRLSHGKIWLPTGCLHATLTFLTTALHADTPLCEILIIGKNALALSDEGFDLSKVPDGMKVIVFEQSAEVLEKRLGFRTAQYGLRKVFKRVAGHPLLENISDDNLRDWRGAATLLPEQLEYKIDDNVFNGAPTVQWCGITVPRVWRCGQRGTVASVLIEKPTCGDFLPILDGGFSLQYSPLMEYRHGNGMILFCQMDVANRTENDPAATHLVGNILHYVNEWKATLPKRTVVYGGSEEGKKYLEKIGISPFERLFAGIERISENAIVVLGQGPNFQDRYETPLTSVPRLALGLNQDELKKVFPDIAVKTDEHISTYFEPFGVDSPLRGIGPADVHNRVPKSYSLIADEKIAIGNGILGVADEGRTVIFGMAPWQFAADKQGEKRTFRRSAFVLSRILGNMNVDLRTPLVERFHGPVVADEKRWLDGLYLDTPEEWDDPYRFFRW